MDTLTQDKKAIEIVSYFKLSETVVGTRAFNPAKIVKPEKSFRLIVERNPRYVDPNFTVIENEIKVGETKVILISAAGATGKTALAERLSQQLNIPILDLADHAAVGQYSLIGLFTSLFDPSGFSEFTNDLQAGRAALIIDALDEGKTKTSEEGYNAFLNDLVQIAQKANGVTFILLGRGQAVNHTWLYLDDNNINASLLRIAPFTIAQATEFIDLYVEQDNPEGYKRYEQPYKEVRDFIIQSIDGFFSSASQLKKEEIDAFIGYAPVLKSIYTLLRDDQNYIALLEKLKANESKGLDLVIQIVEEILDRERDEKVRAKILPPVLEGRPKEAIDAIMANSFEKVEQCERLLRRQLNKPSYTILCEDQATNDLYNEKMEEWMDEHPFLSEGKLLNPVFESYALSTLIREAGHETLVDEYLATKYNGSFMFFFIYQRIQKTDQIPLRYIPYLFDSIKSLDSAKFQSYLSIDADDWEDDQTSQLCDIEITIVTPDDYRTYDYQAPLAKGDILALSGVLSGVYIEAPLTVRFSGKKVALGPPLDIRCDKLIISCQELSLERGLPEGGPIAKLRGENGDLRVAGVDEQSHDIIIDSQEIEIDYSSAPNPKISPYLGEGSQFIIFSPNRPSHPYGTYHNAEGCSYTDDYELKEKYLRFRRIVTTLRSHSKGVLARYKYKIEHRRVLQNDIGRAILDALIKKGILYSDQKFYKWNPGPANQYLGIDYKAVSQMQVSSKLDQFLNEI